MPHLAVKGIPEGKDCLVFGLTQAEVRKLQGEAPIWGHRSGQDGRQFAWSPLVAVQALSSLLGYRVVATAQSTHATVVYTLYRPPFQRY